MSPLPFNTTTVSVVRDSANAGQDSYDSTPNPQTVFTNVRAVISPPSGTAKLIGGTRIDYDAELRCDSTALQPLDTVTDAVTGQQWTVLSVSPINALGLTFTLATLRRVTGSS